MTAIITIAALATFLTTRCSMGNPSLVFDAADESVLETQGVNEPWYPASLTKLMTAYVTFTAISRGKISRNERVVISKRAHAQPVSRLGIAAGSLISVDLALKALLAFSANDIAMALAETVGGSEENFVRLMNDTARQLAMTGTYYANPSGLPDVRQVTTAHDLAILVDALIRDFPDDFHYFSEPSVTIGNKRYHNRNTLLGKMAGIDGIKNGFICNSGYNIVASATRNGRRLVAIVLGAESKEAADNTARALLETGFADGAGNGIKSVEALPDSGLPIEAPQDMAGSVCKREQSLKTTPFGDLHGWSAVLGRGSSPNEATALLVRQLAATRYVFYGGRSVITQPPGRKDHLAIVDSLSRAQSRRLCEYLHRQGAYCRELSPHDLAQISVPRAKSGNNRGTGPPLRK